MFKHVAKMFSVKKLDLLLNMEMLLVLGSVSQKITLIKNYL